MAYLTSAVIHGLCGRDKPLKLRFDRHLNVIYGVNGAGKTSILRVLHYAMVGRPLEYENVAFTTAEVSFYSERLGREITRWVSVDTEEIARRQKKSTHPPLLQQNLFDEEFEWDTNTRLQWRREDLQDNLRVQYPHGYLPITRLFGDIGLLRRRASPGSDREAEEIYNELFEQGLNEIWITFYNKILSNIRDAQQEGLANIFEEVFRERSNEERPKSVPPNLYEKVRRFIRRQNPRAVFADAGKFNSRIKDDLLLRVSERIFEVETKIEQHSQPIELLKVEIDKLFSGKKTIDMSGGSLKVSSGDGRQIRLSHLSSGEKNLLRILIDLFSVGMNSLLVDEPELSMHIDWQTDLVRIMRRLNPEAQLIFATHSPEILSSAAPHETIEI